jgi:hypothetical protein
MMMMGQVEMNSSGSVLNTSEMTMPSSQMATTSLLAQQQQQQQQGSTSQQQQQQQQQQLLGLRRVTSPPKEVGIQAGESLIKYLRKLSDFSSVASASESPAELVSLSPRLSIATSEGAEWYMHQAAYQAAQHSSNSSGIPTTTRSSFDAFDLYSVGGGDSSASTSEWEDAWVQQLLQYQQFFQQQQQNQYQQESLLLSPPQLQQMGKGGLSPIPASATGSSGKNNLIMWHKCTLYAYHLTVV